MSVAYRALRDITRPITELDKLDAAPLHLIPGEVAPYLRPSRYCHSDKFVSFVEKRFGHLAGGRKVAAIRDWIEAELTCVPGSSDADTNVRGTRGCVPRLPTSQVRDGQGRADPGADGVRLRPGRDAPGFSLGRRGLVEWTMALRRRHGHVQR